MVNRASRDRFPPPLSQAGSSGLPKSTPPALSRNQVRSVALEALLQLLQLARHLLLWSQKHLRSLRAIHITGVFNQAANELLQAALPGEWRLHTQAVQLILSWFGVAQVDLFASPETAHCQCFYSLSEATLGTDALPH